MDYDSIYLSNSTNEKIVVIIERKTWSFEVQPVFESLFKYRISDIKKKLTVYLIGKSITAAWTEGQTKK